MRAAEMGKWTMNLWHQDHLNVRLEALLKVSAVIMDTCNSSKCKSVITVRESFHLQYRARIACCRRQSAVVNKRKFSWAIVRQTTVQAVKIMALSHSVVSLWWCGCSFGIPVPTAQWIKKNCTFMKETLGSCCLINLLKLCKIDVF